MYDITAENFINIADAKLITGNKETALKGFKKDTEEIKEGDTYIGVQGEKVNRRNIF